jgi:hypothetical protein
VEVKTCQEERHAVLGPYLHQLEVMTRSGDTDGSSEIELGFRSLHLDSWETEILRKALARPAAEPNGDWCSLLAEGVAFQSKFLAEISTLKAGEDIDPEQLVEINSRLMTDAGIGLALMTELQSVIDSMVGRGEIEQAKKLSGFRNKIGHSVTKIKERIGKSAFEAAEVISGGLAEQVAEPAPAAPRPMTLEAEPDVLRDLRDLPDGRVHTTRSVEPQTRSQLRPLLLTLAALLLIWGVFVLPRARPEPLPVLTSADLPRSAAIASVTARPPSLYVEVESRAWRGMTEPDRRQLVEKVGAAAKAAGYRGARLSTSKGQTVARWLEQRGTWLAPARQP